MIQRFWKPWFVHRPSQALRRLLQPLRPATPGYRPLAAAWGATILADPSKTIGAAITATGVYDLTVGEVLARLIAPGDLVVDAGANIGYMTALSLAAAGPGGRVLSFEPHPDLFPVLTKNIETFRTAFAAADSEPHALALGDAPGTANLVLPADFGGNDGVAHIQQTAAAGDRTLAVTVETLDSVLGARAAAVMKIDVEGFEPQVLRGAAAALAEHRIRHIVFEDHSIRTSEVVRILGDHGYSIHAIGWAMNGPTTRPVAEGSLNRPYEPANFVATVDAADLAAKLAPRGWRTLRRLVSPH